MSSTYINLVRQFVMDVGIEGSVLSLIDKLTGMHAKAAYWIAEADVEIQRKWVDWDFLYTQRAIECIAGIREYNIIDARAFDLRDGKVFLQHNDGSAKMLTYVPYEEASGYNAFVSKCTGTPAFFSVNTKKSICLFPTPESTGYSINMLYWKNPKRMQQSEDTSPIPAHFDRLIITKAKQMWAEHDEAVIPLNKGVADLAEMMAQLEAECLPGNSSRFFGSQFRPDATVVVE